MVSVGSPVKETHQRGLTDGAVDACHHCQQNGSVTAVVLGHVCLVVKHHETSRYQDPNAHCPHFPKCNVESPLTLNHTLGTRGTGKPQTVMRPLKEITEL